MFNAIKEIFQYRDLLMMLTMRDLRVRYKQASMGFLWAIFMPVVAVCAGILIKKAMAVVSQQPLELESIISITVKTLPWTFFISSIRFSVQALVGNSSLVTKIYFPRAVLVLSSILACLFDFAVAMAVVIVLLAIFKVGVSIYLLWAPLLLVLLVLYTFGLGLILSAANLFYRDIKYVVEIILMFGIFFTPVFFSASDFGRWKPLLLVNPIGSILEECDRVVVLHQMPDLFWLSYAVITSLLVLYLGIAVFHKAEPLFAENI
ncbi:MAG: ABC transporter permease [Candidatus Omnitrophica bacterium]|nr:ABC transporter permease [Candidatus Omnitrophota bacterium]